MTTAFIVFAIVMLLVAAAEAAALVALFRRLLAARSEALAERTAEIAQVHETYRTALERIGNIVNYGTMTPPPASVDREPQIEERLSQQIEEDVIARGVENLRREYEVAGIKATDDELRADVIALLTDTQVLGPASVAGLPRV